MCCYHGCWVTIATVTIQLLGGRWGPVCRALPVVGRSVVKRAPIRKDANNKVNGQLNNNGNSFHL